MELLLLPQKEHREAALSGSFQLLIPSNNRAVFCVGAFLTTASPGQRRAKARQLEAFVQENAAKPLSEIWAAALKKFPEIGQNIAAIGVISESAALEIKTSNLKSLLLKSEQKQRLLAIQSSTTNIPAEALSGATSIIFLEDEAAQAEELAAFLQEAEQLLGAVAVRQLLSLPVRESVATTPREEKEEARAAAPEPQEGWQRYAPWGVAALTSALFLFSLAWGGPTQTNLASSKPLVDTKPRFIPQEEPEPEPKRPEKKTKEPAPETAPASQAASELSTRPVKPSTPATKTTPTPKTTPKTTPKKTNKKTH